MLAKLSVDQALMKARSYAKNGEIEEAQKLYEGILLNFSHNKRAQQGLADLNNIKQKNITNNPPQELIDDLISLYKKNQLGVVVKNAQALTKQYPETFMLWNILGTSAAQIDMPDQAIIALKKVISLKPDYAEVYVNIAVVLQQQNKLDEAIEACNKAVLLKPNNTNAYYNMGNVLKDQGKLDEAVEAYDKAISLNPDYADAYNNMGITLQRQGKLDEAIEAFNKAVLIDHKYTDANYNMGNVLLQTGRIKEGLEEYEWRWQTDKLSPFQRHFSKPMWDGKLILKDKTVLIWCEQGIGDTMNWSSCLSRITSCAKHVILECQNKLVPLLSRSFPNVEVKAQDKSLDADRDDFDLHLPMGSLYKHFIDEIIENEKGDAYLVPDPARVKFWRKRLKSLGKGPYIGICWKSSIVSAYRLQHYPPISDWSPVLTTPNIMFINLQYTDYADDILKAQDEFGVTIHNFDDLDQYDDIDDVAALTAALDMVVSTKATPPMISAGVGTATMVANWRQSDYNNILNNPLSTSFEMIHRDTSESWDKVFKLIEEHILRFKNKNT